MKPDFSVRSINPDEVDLAVTLLQAQLEEHEIQTPPAALRRVIEQVVAEARHGFIALAFADAEAVGIAYAAAHLSAEHGGTIGWLEELYVVPAWRSRGAGSALLREVASRAEALGWRSLELEVVRGHERTVPLYERHHFRALSRTRFQRQLGA